MVAKTKRKPARLRLGILCWLCLGWLASSSSAYAFEPGAQIEAAKHRAQAREQSAMGWRLAIATSALILVAVPLLSRRSTRKLSKQSESDDPDFGTSAATIAVDSRIERVRVGLLMLLAVASLASYYGLFQPRYGAGFKDTDVYHYYMASKYFSEVGYFDLYHCTVLALTDSGVESRFALPEVRDQRTLHIHTPETALAAALQCRKQFSGDRWLEFADDVAWFDGKFRADQWRLLLRDHGYNPSPVWNAIGGAITSRVPLRSAAFRWLINFDRVLMLGVFGLIVWAFGVEVAALSAIVWGTGQHWSHSWIGDSLLRNLWLFAVIAGLCSLKKGKEFLAGAFLSLASLLRVFPAIFVLGFAVHCGSRMRRNLDVGWRPGALRFALGATSVGLLLLLFAALSSEWGATAYLEFYEKISVFSDKNSLNKLGLSSLIWRAIMMGTGHLTTGADGNVSLSLYAPTWLPYVIRGVQLAVVVPALFLFWRATGRIRAWEASALGFALIPLLSNPANYYFAFVICGALLAIQRPRIQVIVLASAALWIANGLWFYRLPEEYLGAGIIAVTLPLAMLYEMSREPSYDCSARA